MDKTTITIEGQCNTTTSIRSLLGLGRFEN